MLHVLPRWLRLAICFFFFVVNTVFWMTLFIPVAILKFCVPIRPWVGLCDRILSGIASGWIACNSWGLQTFHRFSVEVNGMQGLERGRSYLVLSNHQSWVDIVVLQKVFNRRIPQLKFFLKKQLMWVPLLGFAWWALDFPFMRRYTAKQIEKNPSLKGKDLERTRRFCEKYKRNPVSILNFVEGTRKRAKRRGAQASPFHHLLRPKAGGVALVMHAMSQHLHRILNVTIVYPDGVKGLAGLLAGEVKRVRVEVESVSIQHDLIGDYANDADFRLRFQTWINEVWARKDKLLDEMHANCMSV